MLNRLTYFLILFVTILSFSSCKEEKKEKTFPQYQEVKESLRKNNEYWYKEEMLLIESFIKRRNWNMQQTGSGIFYEIYSNGDTTKSKIKEGQIARVNYKVYVIDSTLIECYDSQGEPEDFMVGMDNVESGLHEAVLYLRKGDKARIILPYWRAFGLIGDMEKIPPQSSLVYDLELVDVIDTDNRERLEKQKADKEKRAKEFNKLEEELH